MAEPARVLEDALTLTADDRARIAHELIHSLQPDDAETSAAWSKEIRRRVDEIEAGTAELEDWEVVRARLEAASRPGSEFASTARPVPRPRPRFAGTTSECQGSATTSVPS
jgi:putative addiction module component (TIGR02574 family)